MAAQVAAKPDWIKLPNMPLLSNIFLPTAPVPKTSEEVNFAAALAPCIRKGREEAVAPLLNKDAPRSDGAEQGYGCQHIYRAAGALALLNNLTSDLNRPFEGELTMESSTLVATPFEYMAAPRSPM